MAGLMTDLKDDISNNNALILYCQCRVNPGYKTQVSVEELNL